jgi:antitoxin (DNA-binding transcriptional repressor) of toxin-antitoxin stability system
MKTVSVRELRYDFKKVESILREGEEIGVTKRRQVIARLVPEPAAVSPMPDFLKRMEEIYGASSLPVSGAELVQIDRERF